MKNSFKNLPSRIISRYVREQKRKTYMRLFVMMLFTALTYLTAVIFFFGAMLAEKILIVNPTPTQLSYGAIAVINFFNGMINLFFYGTLLAMLIVLWKEMKEREFRKTLQAYGIPVIE